jgi:hypothetical protein
MVFGTILVFVNLFTHLVAGVVLLRAWLLVKLIQLLADSLHKLRTSEQLWGNFSRVVLKTGGLALRLGFYLKHFIYKYLFTVEVFQRLCKLTSRILSVRVRFRKSVNQCMHHKIALSLRWLSTFGLLTGNRSVPYWRRFQKWLKTSKVLRGSLNLVRKIESYLWKIGEEWGCSTLFCRITVCSWTVFRVMLWVSLLCLAVPG